MRSWLLNRYGVYDRARLVQGDIWAALDALEEQGDEGINSARSFLYRATQCLSGI